jgi:hypothetical protein
MAREGITLIEVPYWWDGQIDSLKQTVLRHLPEFQFEIPPPSDVQPIPDTPPLKSRFPQNEPLNNAMGFETWKIRSEPDHS